MLPTLQEGDIVIYRPINKQKIVPKRGAIVVVEDPQNPRSLIIKRVYKESTKWLDLRGDNALNSIDSRQFGLVNTNHLRGVVEEIFFKKN